MKKDKPSTSRLVVMNGWRDAPHCWWRYLLMPFGWDRAKPPGRKTQWVSLSLFGFAFFWIFDGND